jgi:Na+-translocating ferredoxin:NAD+ oxidoreductase subunit C
METKMKLPTFKKGIHPDDQKSFSNQREIAVAELPDEVWIPLQQHIGAPCEALVKKNDKVLTGQKIGESKAFVSAPVHSSVTGTVKAVDLFPHALGGRIPMVHIKRDAVDEQWTLMEPVPDWQNASPELLKKNIREAGIVGMGGAGFPTHVKLSPPAGKLIDSFILNGVECEPYLTADHRLMLEKTDTMLTGMMIMMRILGVERGHIGIENNKPDAIEKVRTRVVEMGLPITVVPLAVKYPQGAEKMLIQAVLKRQVPAGGLPMDAGVVVNNVGTALAVYGAVCEGKPLIERIVTITGNGIENPSNLMARIGTPFRHLIQQAGGIKEELAQVFMGGPMMGQAQYNLDVPMIKTTSGIIGTTDYQELSENQMPCIRCGSCVTACPMFLLPTRIARFSELRRWDDAAEYGIMNCIECGSCAFACPSHIPLVQLIRLGKNKVAERARKSAS